MHRRKFIQNAGIATAGVTILNFPVFGKKAPSNKVIVAVSGVNSRGAYLAKSYASLPDVEVAYICDVEEKAIQNGLEALKDAPKKPTVEKDIRKLVAQNDFDALIIAMPDHWHTPAAILGVTHAETGKHLAERWRLGPEVTTVIAYHHEISRVSENKVLTAIVTIADLLCRMNKMGYGFPEDRQVDLSQEPAFACLMNHCAMSNTVDWARLTFEMEGYLQEVRRLVSMFYRTPQ